jgi:hypothetical protein
MDLNVKQQLERMGLVLDRPELLQVAIEFGPHGQPVPLGEEVQVMDEAWKTAHVRLKPISQLWTAAEVTPFLLRTSPHHEAFLTLMQSMAGIYCTSLDQPETDAEFERIYRKLRWHPDAEDHHPLFSYLQGAARLYLSLSDMSRTEYETLTRRLGNLAERFCSHTGSTNYHRQMLHRRVGS